MKKKIICLGLVLIMGLGLAACNTCNTFDLDACKTTAKAELDTLTEAEAYYSPDNWAERLRLIEDGKKEIDKAKNKDGVDSAVAMTNKNLSYILYNTRIDAETRSEIDRLYVKWFTNDYYKPSLEEISSEKIDCYYGQYAGFYVFHFHGWGFAFNKTIIDGLIFMTHATGGILALSEDYGGERKPGEIYENVLKQVYEKGYITRADLEAIYEINCGIIR